jgi:tryptophan synthase alpha chain
MSEPTALESKIRSRMQDRDILLMTHIVLGYPSFDASIEIVDAMVEAGVDLVELQIPFSEPIADGPVILHANQKALAAGSRVAKCFEVARLLSERHPIPFLFMTYYNIVFQYGFATFAKDTTHAGLSGAIIPDLPYEEGQELLDIMDHEGLAPVFIYSPNTSNARMEAIAERAHGFVYCVARKGVTGAETDFAALGDYLARCRAATSLPLALGFGVKNAEDVQALKGLADIAVVGSETIRVIDEQGLSAVAPFIRSLR